MDAIVSLFAGLLAAGVVGMVCTSLFKGNDYSSKYGTQPFGRSRNRR